jgi:hypothetical protein
MRYGCHAGAIISDRPIGKKLIFLGFNLPFV